MSEQESLHDWDLILQRGERIQLAGQALGKTFSEKERSELDQVLQWSFFRLVSDDEFEKVLTVLAREGRWDDFLVFLVESKDERWEDAAQVYYQYILWNVWLDPANAGADLASFGGIASSLDLEVALADAKKMLESYSACHRIAKELLGDEW